MASTTPSQEAVCSRHQSPWPCLINNNKCEKETHPKLVKAILEIYKNFGVER